MYISFKKCKYKCSSTFVALYISYMDFIEMFKREMFVNSMKIIKDIDK